MVSVASSVEVRTAAAPAKASVAVLDAADPAQRQAWIDLWSSWPQKEVFAHPEFARLFARPMDRVVAVSLRTDRGGILYPVIVRPLAAEPWAPSSERACDLTNPYGYGGPFAWSVTPADATEFWSRFDAWAAEIGAVAAFARLSLFSGQMIPYHGETEIVAPNVVRSVDMPSGALWMDYKKDARRNVEIARKNGAQVEFDTTGSRLDDFLKVYVATMDRRNALAGYYFPRSFFESILRQLSGQFVFAHAVVQGKVVSSELFLVSTDHAYSFLGGTLKEALDICPNYLLKHETFVWCHEQGKKAVVLGGGYQPNDGILAYKRRFGQHVDVPFLVGRKTFDTGAANRLLEARREWERAQGRDWTPAPGFFPGYRA